MPELKKQPSPGFDYIVVSGDWISRISARAYGDYKYWTLIRDANLDQVKGPDATKGGDQVWFLPGQKIFIPELPQAEKKFKTEISGKEKDEETFIIEGIEIPLQSFTFTRAIDTGSNVLICAFAWEPRKDKKIDELTQFYRYPECQFYIGGKIKFAGIVYDVEKSNGKSGRSIELTSYTRTVDFIDSTVDAPYEKNNTYLLDEIKRQARPFGINVILDDNADQGGKIDRVAANKQDKRFDYCAKLCAERGLLLSCTFDGDLIIIVADTKSKPVGTIQEKYPPVQEYSFKSKGRGRFNIYRAKSQTPKKLSGAVIVKDDLIPRGRTISFTAPAIRSAELQKAAEWKKNKSAADDLTVPFPVDSWYAPNDEMWDENTKISVESLTLGTEKKGFTFLIKQVDIIKDTSGKTGIVHLVPPEVYTRKKIEEPWRS